MFKKLAIAAIIAVTSTSAFAGTLDIVSGKWVANYTPTSISKACNLYTNQNGHKLTIKTYEGKWYAAIDDQFASDSIALDVVDGVIDAHGSVVIGDTYKFDGEGFDGALGTFRACVAQQ